MSIARCLLNKLNDNQLLRSSSVVVDTSYYFKIMLPVLVSASDRSIKALLECGPRGSHAYFASVPLQEAMFTLKLVLDCIKYVRGRIRVCYYREN